ncbi:hypothetical protein SRHO_G00180410 [Serrasalmus rhombeus]
MSPQLFPAPELGDIWVSKELWSECSETKEVENGAAGQLATHNAYRNHADKKSLILRTTFTWYRNGHRSSSNTDQLHLQPVSRESKDMYRCAVLGQNLQSPEVTLNVRYGPKSVSVSISPSAEIVEVSLVEKKKRMMEEDDHQVS